MDTFSVSTSGPSTKKVFEQIHYLDYLPHFQKSILSDSSYEDCEKLFEESSIHYGQKNYIDAEDTLIRAVVASHQQDELCYVTLRYKTTFLLIKCGIHLGDIPTVQSYLHLFVSLKKPADLKVNGGELVETLNVSPLWTLRRHAVLSLFHQSGLCSETSENLIHDFGEIKYEKSTITKDPVKTVSFCQGLLRTVRKLLEQDDARVPLALEYVRSSIHIGQLAAENDIIDGSGISDVRHSPDSEENRLLFECLILLGDYRRIEFILRTGKESSYTEDEIISLLTRSARFSVQLGQRRSLLTVLHRYNRCLDVSLNFCEYMEELRKADVLCEAEKYEEAVECLTSFIDRYWKILPNLALADIYLRRSSCYVDMNDVASAKSDCRKSLEQYPDLSGAKMLLEYLSRPPTGSPSRADVGLGGPHADVGLGGPHADVGLGGPHADAGLGGQSPAELDRLSRIPFLPERRKDFPKPGKENRFLQDIIKNGAKLFTAGEFFEAEEEMDSAVPSCEIILLKCRRDNIVDIRSKAAIWLMKIRIMIGNLDVTERYAGYLHSLPKNTVETLAPEVMTDLIDTVNKSCMSTIRRHACLDLLHAARLCENHSHDDIKRQRLLPPYPLVSKDPRFLAGLCQQLMHEGLTDLEKMNVADALESFRTTIAFARLITQDQVRSMYYGPRSTVRFMEYKCLFLLADHKGIHCLLRDVGIDIPWDDDDIFQFLDASKAPESRKKTVLSVLNQFNRCIRLTGKDIDEIRSSVDTGNSYYKQKAYEVALTCYDAALERAGTGSGYPELELSRVYYNRGSTYLCMGMRLEAKNDLKKALETNHLYEKAKRKLESLQLDDSR